MAGTFLFSAAICVLMPHGNIDHFAHVGGVMGGFFCYLVMTPNHRIPLQLPQHPLPSPHIVRHGLIDAKHFRRREFSNAPPAILEAQQLAKLALGTVLLVVMMQVVEQADWIADIDIFSFGHFVQAVEGDGAGVFGSAMAMMAETTIHRKSRWHFEPKKSKMLEAITSVRRDGLRVSAASAKYAIPQRTLRRRVH